MKDTLLSYSIGALLYCPANNESIADSLICGKFGNRFSQALCLEDTIKDDRVEEAEHQLTASLLRLERESQNREFYMPKLFIRVRNPRQIEKLYENSGAAAKLITGFIIPKFSLENADTYIREIIKLNSHTDKPVYMMPILESPTMIDLRFRYEVLYELKDKLDKISDLVLNIRVGGNDLCHVFGYRRRCNESIHEIKPVITILTDILTVFGSSYVVSGPVWEYYRGFGWDLGLRRELELDRLNGFIGKTVIHPNQIPLVNEAYRVTRSDYEDAASILNWDSDLKGLVSGSKTGGRMNEFKTHYNWAKKTLILSEVYGITD